MADSPEASGRKAPGSIARDVLVIVLAGVVLGVGYNALLARDGSESALSWVRHEPKLARLEALSPAARSLPAPAPALAVAAPAGAVPVAPPRERAPGDAAASPPHTPPASAPVQRASAPAAPVPAVPGPGAPAVDVPAVPETREPLEVGGDIVLRLHAAHAALFVDARSAEEYAQGHIPGAVSLPFDDVFQHPELARTLQTGGLPIVAYCSGGDCDLARSLAFSLIDAGHKRVLVFRDGLPGWTAAGRPAAVGGGR